MTKGDDDWQFFERFRQQLRAIDARAMINSDVFVDAFCRSVMWTELSHFDVRDGLRKGFMAIGVDVPEDKS